MGRTLGLIAALAGVVISGCGSRSLVTTTRTTPPTHTQQQSTTQDLSSGYLAALSAEQAKLAAAERRIPKGARTPPALAKAIGLLRAAIGRLGRDLLAIKPPRAVAGLHQRLVVVVGTYEATLAHAQRLAGKASGVLAAARLLVSSTAAASRDFGATIDRIDRLLAQH
jgi:hypothetical protein